VFVDASAIVSILTEEADARDLAAVLDSASEAFTSPIAIWEAAASISRKTGGQAAVELPIILEFLEVGQIGIESVEMVVTTAAVSAFDRYGRRSGHAADLNMGDCFAYAFAATRKTSLLFKGKDFVQTDVERPAAMP
jgi:ribonuclease VapC